MSEDIIPTWDLFISHASEDKAAFVEPLAKALTSFGVNVWYDNFQLKVGDSLSRSIDKGLGQSDYGLVVLSPAFFSKRWPEYELRGLTSREMLGDKKVILPVWHGVSAHDIVKFSPSLADKLALSVDGKKPVEIAIKIIEAIRPDIFTKIQRRIAYKMMLRSAELREVDPRELKISPIRHEKLPVDLIGRIRLVRAALLGVYPHSMEFWVTGFQRDAHPSNEVCIWEHMAAVYIEFISMHEGLLESEKTNAVFSAILELGVGHTDLPETKCLTHDEIKIIKNMYQNSTPPYDWEENKEREDSDGAPELMDQEHFPKDLPEDLIEELLGTKR